MNEQFEKLLEGMDAKTRRQFAEYATGVYVVRTLVPMTEFNPVGLYMVGREFAYKPEQFHVHVRAVNLPHFVDIKKYWHEDLTTAVAWAKESNGWLSEQIDNAHMHGRHRSVWEDYPIHERLGLLPSHVRRYRISVFEEAGLE